jgi:uncharacterized DUF497 family protein
MDVLSFEWDEAKSKQNVRKHGVSFPEAQTVFFDDHAVEFYDDLHSEWENRFLLLGRSSRSRILLICYCLRAPGSVIRLISARKATSNERRHYP